MKEIVLDEIRNEIREAKYFAVLTDESKDVSKKEQVVVAVRYLHRSTIHKEFIGIAEAEALDAEGLCDAILNRLSIVNTKMVNCVGQGYDGASVVAGHLNGVQRKLREKTNAEMGCYVHCFAHRLNLVVADVVNSIKCIGDTIYLCKALHSFISKAAVHDRWTKIQELHKLTFMEIGLVSDTRWTCQAK